MSNLNLPAAGQNNVWYDYNDSDSVIVFLHGIFSDSRDCWMHKDPKNPQKEVYWPDLVRRDPRFDQAGIFLAGFYTSIDAGPYEIRNCADEVWRALNRKESDATDPVISKRRIVFLCHSTGGIVARYLLEKNAAAFRDHHIGLVLIASPSYGAKLADKLDLLARFYNQRLGIQLQWGSWSLRDLDARFKDLVNERRIPNLAGVEAYENHFIFHRKWLPNRTYVVTEESAGRYFGAPVLLRNTDHFSTVKPDSVNHPSHQLLVDFWTRQFDTIDDKTETEDVLDIRFGAALVELLDPAETNPFAALMSRVEPFPGIPYFSEESNHPTAWPPRVEVDRLQLDELIQQFANRPDVSSAARQLEEHTDNKVTVIGEESEESALRQIYVRLRYGALSSGGFDDPEFQAIVGERIAADLASIETKRDEIIAELPNRLLIVRVENRGKETASDFRLEVEGKTYLYDATAGTTKGLPAKVQIDGADAHIAMERLPPGYHIDVRIWYRYRPITERVFIDRADLEWERTQGIRIHNITVHDARVRFSRSILKDLQAYNRYPIDLAKGVTLTEAG